MEALANDSYALFFRRTEEPDYRPGDDGRVEVQIPPKKLLYTAWAITVPVGWSSRLRLPLQPLQGTPLFGSCLWSFRLGSSKRPEDPVSVGMSFGRRVSAIQSAQ
jgi:hypothetical protein